MSDDAMKDFFGDFPGRPDHPDFWKLSETVLGMDAIIEDDPDGFERTIAAVVDPRSVVYMAQQRVLRSLGTDKNPLNRIAGTACWLDGFIAGVRYRGGS